MHSVARTHPQPPSPARNINRVCFRGHKINEQGSSPSRLASPHPGPSTVSRETCSLLQASGISLEFLLLSPRSAPTHVPAGLTPPPFVLFLQEKNMRRASLLTCDFLFIKNLARRAAQAPRSASSIFEATPHRRASCYALLRRFQLPWPRPRCLNRATLFVVSDARGFRRVLPPLLVHPISPYLLTRQGPLCVEVYHGPSN